MVLITNLKKTPSHNGCDLSGLRPLKPKIELLIGWLV